MVFTKGVESDNLIFMKTMTATEVARNFSIVLDEVEAGEEVEITRGKRVIAVISPKADTPNAPQILAFVDQWLEENGPMDDETYALYQEVLAARHQQENKVVDPWGE